MHESSLEDAIWNGVLRVNKTREKYAVECARSILKKLEAMREARIGARGVDVATMDVLELSYESKWLRGVIRVYRVEEAHVELCVRLVQQYMRTRCMRILGAGDEAVGVVKEEILLANKPMAPKRATAAEVLAARLKAKWTTKVQVIP